MAIYTRTGDKGETSLFGGKRISKSSFQVEAYGSVDELTSFLGLVAAKIKKHNFNLLEIQKDLYKIMAFLAGAKTDLSFLENKVKNVENEIDRMDKKLPKLTKFILPGGTELSSWFHILRITCRRSERSTVRFFSSNSTIQQYNNITILKYLNRLSDLFFTLARFHNKRKDVLA
ncbi:ATP:cob(I)alamin adenosyltransferase [Candidatus Roizmanbacteria bacterium RIFCSPLOWO2_01_FULL_37_12]|uniref:Corrinoid adenosyltransferase n=1 Tax=Candidatus Roizmanbacteria bacterium RIFCSPLOWO2_01_FULL_37_12 TaxID=1802056 RepID=A0A1F7IBF7_9BACT|nr:MAG: ATP:cob(I)alamin adenosyltransferase [Candidatus Roizmanbacteria bacterium RIFCSPLOWO2_01_FULL_37_12]